MLGKQLQKVYGKGFYRATQYFPSKIQDATYALYGFVRYVDEIVDTEWYTNKLAAKEHFNRICSEWRTTAVHPVVIDAKKMYTEYAIPESYMESFLVSMEEDMIKNRYATYTELETYMYGSATVIGFMMSTIIGYKEGALPYAQKLGEAFQLINFIRDIKEDFVQRNRVYIPKEDMDRFGVVEEDFLLETTPQRVRDLVAFEIQRAKKLYDEALPGIRLLHPEGRRGVYIAARIYGALIHQIEKKDYTILEKRIIISPLQKLWIALTTKTLSS